MFLVLILIGLRWRFLNVYNIKKKLQVHSWVDITLTVYPRTCIKADLGIPPTIENIKNGLSSGVFQF